MRAAASAPPRRSGCQRLASARYAALTSSAEAPGGSPRAANGSIALIVPTVRSPRGVATVAPLSSRGEEALTRRPRTAPSGTEPLGGISHDELLLALDAARAGTYR